MASEEMGSVPTPRMDNSVTSQLLFQDENPVRFTSSPPVRRVVGEPGPKPGFVDDKFFSIDNRDRYFSPELRRIGGVYAETSERQGGVVGEGRSWKGSGPVSTPSSGDDDDDDDEDDDEDEDENDDEDDDEGDAAIEGLVRIGGINSHSSVVIDKIGGEISKDHASFGSSARQMMKDGGLVTPGADGNRASPSENGQQGRSGAFNPMVTIAERDGDVYYSQLLQGTEGSSQVEKDAIRDNGCGFSGRKDGSDSNDPAESLRAIFSDPITGVLMDDAMILPCGHSFGGGGIQQVIKMKACYTCSRPVSEDSVGQNLSLRMAVQAFRREEDLLMYRPSKRKRERFGQEKGYHGDLSLLDSPRGRGVQFPFAVTDRVIIKGNKRTPQRFVGREAIVTTQCLNGWYVVKTLDNAESVKLQYRSLAKVPDNPASRPTSDKITPNWL